MPRRKQRPEETDAEFQVYLDEAKASNAAAAQRYREAHPDRVKACGKAMRERAAINPPPPEVQAARRKWMADWRERNRERNRQNAMSRYHRLFAENPEQFREAHRRQYWTAREAELELLGNPTGCAVCGVDPIPSLKNGRDGRFIDHDHRTGMIRGVVCGYCNRALHVVDMREVNPEWWENLTRHAASTTGRLKPTVLRPTTNPKMKEPI